MALGHWLKDYIGPKDSGGSASIPTPTVEDAGKVLAVSDEGQYELANSGGGTAPLIVNVNGDTLDKTWQEIHDAFVGGQTIIVHYHDDNLESDALVSVVTREVSVVTHDIGYEIGTMYVSYITQEPNGYPTRGDS